MSTQHSQEPSLGRLRRRARSLVHQHQAHDAAVAELLQNHHPAFDSLSTDEIFDKPLTLSDAQLALARANGQSARPQASLRLASPVDKHRVVRELIPRPEYRRELAARKGLPPIGTKQISQCGVEYAVIDHGSCSHKPVSRERMVANIFRISMSSSP